MLAGFSDLTTAQLDRFWDVFGTAPEENQDVDPQRIEDIFRSIEILEGLDPKQIRGWLARLSEAYEENRFQEEFEGLLNTSQNFQRYIHALWILSGGGLGGSQPPSPSDFLRWATSMQTTLTLRERMYQAIGTLYGLSWFAAAGWHMHGFLVEGSWAAGIMYLPQALSDGRNIVALVGGDNCSQCGTERNIQNIVDWLKVAIRNIPLFGGGSCTPSGSCEISGNPLDHAYPWQGNERIIILMFTNPNATGVDNAISRIQREFGSDPFTPGIYVIRFKEGYWQVECVAGKCSEQVVQIIQEALDRVLAMSTNPRYNLWSIWVACGADADCILWMLEQLEKEYYCEDCERLVPQQQLLWLY